MSETEVSLYCDASLFPNLLGPSDKNLKIIEEKIPVKIITRDNKLILRGNSNEVKKAEIIFKNLVSLLEKGISIDKFNIRSLLEEVDTVAEGFIPSQCEPIKDSATILNDLQLIICKDKWGKPVKPRTSGQAKYIKAMFDYSLTFSIGPAGTGKTFLAVAVGVSLLLTKKYEHLILTRPAIEAGEKLGFLPGDIQEKVDPYFKPIYDALFDLIDYNKCNRLIENGTIEIAPLAYMRGRTLENAFIILDEAQNTTSEQMKMFLTRFGQGSQVVVTGDVTQIDLPEGRLSGLIEAAQLLSNIPDIKFVFLTEKDIVRHPLVKKIIVAYEKKSESRVHSENNKKSFDPSPARHIEEPESQNNNK